MFDGKAGSSKSDPASLLSPTPRPAPHTPQAAEAKAAAAERSAGAAADRARAAEERAAGLHTRAMLLGADLDLAKRAGSLGSS